MKNVFLKCPHISTIVFSLSLVLTLGACTTLKVDTAKMQSVKKVAVVGFDVMQQQPVQTGDLLKIATHQSVHKGPGVGTRSEQEHVAELYDLLVKKLSDEKGFSVVKRTELTANPSYAAIFKKRTEGFTSRPMIPEHYELYQAPKVLDGFDVATLSADEKKSLQEALKVDAILVVKSVVDLNMSGVMASLVGQATMSPSSTSLVSMIDARSGEEIWSDTRAVGQPVENNEKSFLGMAETAKVNALAKQAVTSSLDSAFQRIKAKAL